MYSTAILQSSGRVVTLGCLTVVILLAQTRPAQACGACECAPIGASRLLPGLTREAPTNYRPLVVLAADAAAGDIVVTDGSDAGVAIRTTAVSGDGRAVWLAAATEWEVGGSYTVHVGQQNLGSFDVVGGRDEAPPMVGEAVLRPGQGASGLCTAVRGGQLTLSGVSDAYAYELVAVLEIGAATLVIDVFGDASRRVYTFGDGVDDADCLGTAQAELPEGAPLEATLSVYDQAGNVTALEGLSLSGLGDIGAATCGEPGVMPSGDPVDADGGVADGDGHDGDRGRGADGSSASGCAVSGAPRGGGGLGLALMAMVAMAWLRLRRRNGRGRLRRAVL